MSSAASQSSLSNQFFQLGFVQRLESWLQAMPHPSTVVEIAAPHVAVARWVGKSGHLEGVASEALPTGAVMASPVETNVVQPDAVRSALRKVLGRLEPGGAPVALLIPDPVVRVFILPFDTLPRRASDALPLLRWRLKKSVPFDMDDTVVSWMRQVGREGGLEVLTAVARQPIIREYEALLESLGARAGVILSSTLAALPLLEERGATLFVRLTGKTLTTVIVHGAVLCVYRSTEVRADAATLDPKAMLDEVFPAVAYYQDSWGSTIDRSRLSGFGPRQDVFTQALAEELSIPAGSVADAESMHTLESQVRDLVPQGLDALAGWMMNGKS